MNQIKSRKARSPARPGPLLSLLLAVLLTGAVTLFALWIQPNSLRAVLAVLRSQPLLIVLNCLPVGFLVLAFSFLFGNVFYAAALVNGFVSLLSLINRIKLNNLRLYVNAQNPFTFTKVKIIDPESRGDESTYPIMRTFIVGLNVRF